MKLSFGLLSAIFVTFIMILFARWGVEYSKEDVTFCLLIILISLGIYFKGQQQSALKGHWAKPGNVLLIGLFIVNYQQIIDLLLGLRNWDDFPESSVVVRTCYASTLGVLSTILSLSFFSYRRKHLLPLNNIKEIDFSFLVVIQVIVFLTWVSTININALLKGTLYGVNSGLGAAYLEQLYNYIVIVIIACVCMNSRDGSVKKFRQFFEKNALISWICIGIYMLFRLVSGDRGPFIYTGLLITYAYLFCTKKKIKLSMMLVVIVVGSIIITILGMARQDASSASFTDRVSSSYNQLSYSERFGAATFFGPTYELANSYRCNQYAVADIEQYHHPLHFGTYQLFQIVSVVPFALSYITNTYAFPESMMSSGYYFTLREKGDYYQWGQTGTTCIADFFMDFGLLGVLVGMLLLGLLFAWIDRIVCVEYNISPFVILLVLSYACMSIYIGRGAFIVQLKPILSILAIFYLNYWLFTKKRKRHRLRLT